MKTKIIIILLLVTITSLSAYDRVQAARYAHRYTRLTEGDSLSSKQGIILYSIIIKNLNVNGK